MWCSITAHLPHMSSSSNELTAHKVIWWWSWGHKQFDTQFSKTSKHYWSWLRSTDEELLQGIITKKTVLWQKWQKIDVVYLKWPISVWFIKWSQHDCAQTQQSVFVQEKKNIHYCNKPIGIHVIVLKCFFMLGWKSSFWVLCQIKHFYILSLSFEDEIADCCGHYKR